MIWWNYSPPTHICNHSCHIKLFVIPQICSAISGLNGFIFAVLPASLPFLVCKTKMIGDYWPPIHWSFLKYITCIPNSTDHFLLWYLHVLSSYLYFNVDRIVSKFWLLIVKSSVLSTMCSRCLVNARWMNEWLKETHTYMYLPLLQGILEVLGAALSMPQRNQHTQSFFFYIN